MVGVFLDDLLAGFLALGLVIRGAVDLGALELGVGRLGRSGLRRMAPSSSPRAPSSQPSASQKRARCRHRLPFTTSVGEVRFHSHRVCQAFIRNPAFRNSSYRCSSALPWTAASRCFSPRARPAIRRSSCFLASVTSAFCRAR